MEEVRNMTQLEGVEQPLGPRLRVARERAGLSKKELAQSVGVEVSSIEAWESDQREPRANRLIMLSGLLGVSVSWLLEGRENERMESAVDPTLAAIQGEIDRLQSLLSEMQTSLHSVKEQLAVLAK